MDAFKKLTLLMSGANAILVHPLVSLRFQIFFNRRQVVISYRCETCLLTLVHRYLQYSFLFFFPP